LSATANAWIFQAEPKEWDVDRFLRDVRSGTVDPPTVRWLVAEDASGMKPGDRAYIWRAGDHRKAGVVAVGTVTAAAEPLEEDRTEYRRKGSEDKYAGEALRAELRIDVVLPKPLYRVKLEWTDETKGLHILEFTDAQTSPVAPDEEQAIERLRDQLVGR
jgi:EVE domain